jgi:hypothetical protein
MLTSGLTPDNGGKDGLSWMKGRVDETGLASAQASAEQSPS